MRSAAVWVVLTSWVLWTNAVVAQGNAGFTLHGLIINGKGEAYDRANVSMKGAVREGEQCDDFGRFSINLPPNAFVVLNISHVRGEAGFEYDYRTGDKGAQDSVVIIMPEGGALDPITITVDGKSDDVTVTEVDVRNIYIPNASGGVESILKLLPGVNSNNELSTQYSVRGGNFDENLVYINGIEIYRPFLIRSGQQEGLSIINTQMIDKLQFSAGGFSARYGDKLSSVLDITYKRPKENGVLVEGGLLGGSATVYGRNKNGLLSYIASGRYRSNRYLLNSLDVQGNYQPVFADVQSYLSYKSYKHQIGLMTYYGSNRYKSVPESQNTQFGTVRDAFQIDVFFDGQEITTYNMFLNALTWNYQPFNGLQLHFGTSFYFADEREEFDVLGRYLLSQLDNRIGSEGFGDPQYTLGAGAYLNHARNQLRANIFNVQHRGQWQKDKHEISWGGRYQHDVINDQLREWRYLDSAGYSVPRSADGTVRLAEVIRSDIHLVTNRFQAFVQDKWTMDEANRSELTYGLRLNYWDYNGQLLAAPRVSFGIEPNRPYNVAQLRKHGDSAVFKRNIKLKAATGFYQQPPFYRELRSKDGRLIPGVRAQQSIHAVLGAEWNFELWKRDKPFNFNVETYYKHQWDMIPYEIENVRIRYLPEYTAKGYVVGVDMQVNGEFIPDLPSWFSLSFMSAREDINGDFFTDSTGELVERGYLPKPTDQRYAFNILFQDFLTQNRDYQVHLNLIFAHGLPFGPPGYFEFRNALRIPPYRRVDIGFSKVLYQKDESPVPYKWLKWAERIDVSAEIFNLFGIRNTISYLWVKDIYNRGYSVPNYLTSRRFNVQLRIQL